MGLGVVGEAQGCESSNRENPILIGIATNFPIIAGFLLKGVERGKIDAVFGSIDQVVLSIDDVSPDEVQSEPIHITPLTDELEDAILPIRRITVTRHDLSSTPLTSESDNRLITGSVKHAASAGLVKVGKFTGKRSAKFLGD